MRNTISKLIGAAGLVALAGHLFAGGFYLMLGNPEASPLARKLNAVLTIQATGCHEPASAQLTATAIGVVKGERREIPLNFEKMPTPGMYALTQQWPKEGRWVIKLTGKHDTMFTNSLIPVGPNGVDRLHDKANNTEFRASDIDAMCSKMLPVTTVPAVSDDEALILAAAAGDRDAFGELYVRYARLVHGILLARVPPGDADDMVQDVFLSAMRQLRGLRTAAAFRGWLASIARNRAMDHYRRNRPHVSLDETTENQQQARDSSLHALELLDLIRHLPEAYREPLILRLVEGMTGPEIAQQTGLTPDSVRVNLCRGMKLMRGLMGADAHE